MNSTEAKFTTSSIGQVAFLLWKEVLPDAIEKKLSKNLFLYFGDYNYNQLARHYWEGDYIPACEMGECIRLVLLTIKKGVVDKDFLLGELVAMSDYREWYSLEDNEFTIGEIEEGDSGIIDLLN